MKKLLALFLALVMVMAFAACTQAPAEEPETEPATTPSEPATDDPAPEVTVMSYEEYMAAAAGDKVCIETYVQACRGWWADTICVYAQGPDGGYFMYDMACAEADAAKLVPGTKIRVSGEKAIYDGEVEIVKATFEFVEGADTYVAEALDATAMTGAELEAYMNQLASFKGLTIKSITYKNEGGDDIWLTLSKDGNDYSFTVERYLTDPDSAVYQIVGTLKEGDVVDVIGYLYWYQGSDVHVTGIGLAA